MRDNNGRFIKGISGNPKGRPTSNKVAYEMLNSQKEELVQKVIDKALEGDMAALKLCLERLVSPVKSTDEKIELEGINEAKTLKEKADIVILNISNALISPEVGCKLLNSISQYAKIVEFDELEDRIRSLEISTMSK